LDAGLGVSPATLGAALAVSFRVAGWGAGYAWAAFLAAVPRVWLAAVADMGVTATLTMSETARDGRAAGRWPGSAVARGSR
jgi:hypothetical protein